MMLKKKRNIRQREESSDGEGETTNQIPFLEETYHTQVKNVQKSLQEKLEKKSKKKDGKSGGAEGGGVGVGSSGSLLSFDHDEEEEGEVFQIKKSSHSKKVARKLREQARKERQREELSRLVKESAEKGKKLSDVKGNGAANKQLGTRSKPQDRAELILNGLEAEVAAMEEEDRRELEESVPLVAPGVIPDAATIFAARKRRQIARETGGRADYIPLDDTQRYRNTSGKTGREESRLVREDDNDASGSDEEGRVSFTMKQQTSRQRMQDVISENAEDGSDQDKDHDEELQRWEQEQIKKGTSVPQAQDTAPSSSAAAAAAVAASYYYQQEFPYGQPANQYAAPVGGAYGLGAEQQPIVHALNTTPMCEMPSVTTEQVKKKLKDWFESVKDVHRAHERELDQLQERLESSADTSISLKDTQGDVTGQYRFFQEMKGYVKDLVECFGEKVVIIDGLEMAMTVLLKSRADALAQRRQTDIRDQSVEFTGMLQRAALSANFDSGSKAKSEDITKQRRAAEREARRARRRRARESQSAEETGSHMEGMSSDDEQRESDADKFNKERDRIMAESQQVFEDVMEDYHAISFILGRFQRWKFQHGESYREAYISLCLPKLLGPLVRLQLLDWNPLESDCHDLEEMPWYESMLFFGFQQSEDIDSEDLDASLIPSLVQKVVLPKLTDMVKEVWDPVSSTQTNRLVSLIHKLVEDYPTVNSDSKNTRDLLKALVERMRRTLDEDVYMPLFPKDMLEKSAAANSFMQRQFWSCVKLLGNLLLWHGLISEDHLLELAVDGLLNRYMLLSLQNSDVNDDSILKCERIVATFPPQWFKDLQGDETLRQLEPFCRYLEHAAESLKRQGTVGNDIERRIARSGLKAVTKLLVTIHAMDHALNISQGLSLRDMKEILEKQ
ncbi:PAX3- and PAX7-binding protein 1-like [Acanthaster planci]|uniref:PAX3- and PAX7-binding protein 1-like n=1 Tax=Acanthaster planci TaxID=133434 RepID=A0A8B7Z4A0_ACAPL|nr:PAX3- and PAX7-binding protein 1-like [Acanthaster planci]